MRSLVLLAILSPLGVLAELVPGSFETRLQGTILRINITPSNAFSGKIISPQILSSGTASTFSGALQAAPDSETVFEAQVSPGAETGIAPFKLVYTKDGVEMLEILSNSDPETPVQALQAAKAPAGKRIKGTWHNAFRIDNDLNSAESLDEKISDLSTQLQQTTITSLPAALSSVTAAESNVSNRASEKNQTKIALDVIKGLNPAFFAARENAESNLASKTAELETSQENAKSAIIAKVSASKTLLTELISANNLAKSLTGTLKKTLENAAAVSPGTLSATATSLKSGLSSLLVSKPEAAWFDEYFSFLDSIKSDVFEPDTLEQIFPGSYSVSNRIAFLTSFTDDLKIFISAFESRAAAQLSLDQLTPAAWGSNPANTGFDASAVASAMASDSQADTNLVNAQLALADAQRQSLTVQATKASLEQKKSLLTTASLSLLPFQGYGFFSITLSGSGDTATPGIALLSGKSPSGKTWTHSAQVLASDSEQLDGKIFWSTLAANAPIEGELPFSINWEANSEADLLDLSSEPDPQNVLWSELPCAAFAATPKPVQTNTSNFFRESLSNISVTFGDKSEETAPIGFGARVTASNVLSPELVLAPPQSELHFTTTTSAFYGKFALNGASNFDGLLVSTADGSVQGYGSQISANGTASWPVTIQLAPEIESLPAPVLPEDLKPVLWKGLLGNAVKFQVDPPLEINLTTVKLLKGTTLIASGTVAADGSISLSLSKATAGNDYVLEATRQFISGASPSVKSAPFAIVQKTPPATSFQCLLSYGSFLENSSLESTNPLEHQYDLSDAPDGNPYRARLTITSTATGAYTGKIELVELRNTVTETGITPSLKTASLEEFPAEQSLETKAPLISALSFKGSLSASPSPEHPEALTVTAEIPGLVKDSKHILKATILQGAAPGLLDPPATIDPPYSLSANLQLAPSYSTQTLNPLYLLGSGLQNTAGVKTASGKYQTAGAGMAWAKIADTLTWDYKGSSTIAYTWKTRGATFTGAANVDRDGSIAFLANPSSKAGGAGSIKFPPGAAKPTTSALTKNAYATLLASLQNGSSPGTFLVSPKTLLFYSGSILEETKVKGVFRYHTAWQLPADFSIETLGSFAYAESFAPAYRPNEFPADKRVQLGTPYRLNVVFKGEPQDFDLNITANTSKGASLNYSDPDTKKSVLTLSSANSTAVFSGSILLPGNTKSVAISGVYVFDQQDIDPGLRARGSSADGKVLWSLYSDE